MSAYKIEERRNDASGWHARVKLADGRTFYVGVRRGSRPIRIAFKPSGTFGFHWIGYVRDEKGETLYDERVPKALGVHGLLRDAGLIACEHKLRPPKRKGEVRDSCSCGAKRKPDGTWRPPCSKCYRPADLKIDGEALCSKCAIPVYLKIKAARLEAQAKEITP